jgi:hypothetical protein
MEYLLQYSMLSFMGMRLQQQMVRINMVGGGAEKTRALEVPLTNILNVEISLIEEFAREFCGN